MSVLDSIIEKTRQRVAEKKRKMSLESVRSLAENLAHDSNLDCSGDFYSALKNGAEKSGFSLICEVKKASPSKGVIAPDFAPLKIAREYEKGGADALSVLTEPEFFLGSDEYLESIAKSVNLPCLRKDFIVDAYMIYEAKILGAAAILLITRALDSALLGEFYALANSLKMDTLFEIHTAGELEKILPLNPKIIGINNRNLANFKTDLGASLALSNLIPDGILKVSESGINTKEDVEKLKNAGIKCGLAGESLMRQNDKISAIRNLRG